MDITDRLVAILWSPAMIILCVAVALIYSIALKFPQITQIKAMIRCMLNSEKSDQGISSFQGFAVALGGRVGVGAIAGVATAIAFGGPGAIFWMWIYALFGAATALGEAVLGQIWKRDVNGEYKGGPAYYMDRGIKIRRAGKTLAVLFACSGIFSFGFTAPAIQAFNIAETTQLAFGINPLWTGIFVAALFGLIVYGGMKRIARVAEFVVPIMALAYFAVMIIILVVNAREIPGMFGLIFSSAFSTDAMFGGMWGAALSWGVKRAVYSTEAGMGSAAHAAASAEVSHPVKQGLAQAASIYVDTLFACTATGLMIMVTGMYNVIDVSGGFLREALPGIEPGAGFVQASIDTVLPFGSGSVFIAIAVFFFALTTILSFGFYVMPNIAYLLRNHIKYLKTVTFLIAAFQMFSIILGSARSSAFAWNLADIGVGLMAFINLFAMLFMVKPVKSAMDDYRRQVKAGLDPVFDPDVCGIQNAELWKDIVREKYQTKPVQEAGKKAATES